MKLEKLAAIAEIVSSVAIVATLAYLAVQSQQTNQMLPGNSRQAALEADLMLLNGQLNNPQIAARIVGQDVETIENQTFLVGLLRTREYQRFQYQNGTLDIESFESYMGPLGFWLSSETGAMWWEGNQQQFDPEFADFVDVILERRAR